MRIAGGIWRGKPLQALDGKDVTRPTADRVREAIASSILSARGLSLEGARVLDAFAGSGAVGFELLSRGAARVTAIESSKKAAACIKKNAQSLGVPAQAFTLVVGQAQKLAATALVGAPFDLVFLDPPYALDPELSRATIAALAQAGNLAADALIVHERATAAPALTLNNLEFLREKRYGSTVVSMYRYINSKDEAAGEATVSADAASPAPASASSAMPEPPRTPDPLKEA